MSGPPKGTYVPVSPIRNRSANSSDKDDEMEMGAIMCVGMCVLDIIHTVQKYPEEDSDKRSLDGYWQRGGNASNNCTVLSQLGANVEFLGMMTTNPAFMFLAHDCEQHKIKTTNCPTTGAEPPFSSIVLSEDTGSRTIMHAARKYPMLTHQHFRKVDLNAGYVWMHFEARNADETGRMLRDIRAHNNNAKATHQIKVSLDLEQASAGNLDLTVYADYVFLGKDFAGFCGWQNARTAVFGLRERISELKEPGAAKPNIICPWGECGVVCLDSNDVFSSVSAVKAGKVVDSLGAGDTFCAATVFALAHMGMALKNAVAYGNKVAGYKVTHRGYTDISAAFRGKGFMT